MRFLLVCAALAMGFALAARAHAADDNKKKPEAANAKDRHINVGRLVGKVATVEGSTKNLTVQISLNYPVVVRAGRRISYSIQTINQDVELQAADDIKVRIPKPPPAFDDKGRPKKYSEKELRELKGPGNLPGYTGDFENVRPGQVVQVYLGKKKEALKPQPKKKKGEDQEAPDNKPQATMIVILLDPQT